MADDFYLSVVKSAGIAATDKVLVVCGGPYDRQTMLDCGLTAVTISNLEFHHDHRDYSPFTWLFQDAEAMSMDDASFDWVIVHAGLHHCASPHKALCEMLRTSKKGAVVIEARDSVLMRLAVRLGLTPEFEMEGALLTDGAIGGYRNGPIPNYIYRWTEREFEKTVNSYFPEHKHSFAYRYALSLPLERMTMSSSPLKRFSVHALVAVKWFIELLMPKQGNQFAAIISRGGELQPWLTESDGKLTVNADVLRKDYDPSKYKRNPLA